MAWHTLRYYIGVLLTSYISFKAITAVWYAILLWMVGFVWGVIVFTVPSLKNLPSVLYLSKYPAVSFPLLVVYVILLFVLTPRYLKMAERKEGEGLKFGVTLTLINFVLDFVVYYVLLNGVDYFTYFSIWFAYTLFIVIPCAIGRRFKNIKTRWVVGGWTGATSIRSLTVPTSPFAVAKGCSPSSKWSSTG